MCLEFFSTSLLKAIISRNIKQQIQKRKPFPRKTLETLCESGYRVKDGM